MSASTRNPSGRSGCFSWLACLSSCVEGDVPKEKQPWVEPCGRFLLRCTVKVKKGRRRQMRELFLCSNVLFISNTNSLRDKEEWLFCLRSFIKLAKNKAQPENTSLDTIIEDSEDCTFDSEEDDRVSMDSVKNKTPDATGQGHSQGNEAGHLPMGPDDSTSASSLKKSFSLDLMSEDTPDVLAGGDFATWTTFPSVTSCHQYQGILVAMDQRKNAITTSTLSDPENNWRDYLCVTPEEEEQETVMSLWASAHIAESVMACGDRLDPKVPLYDSYARQHPIFPLHMAEEDLMEHISLLLQGNKDAVSPFSASVTTSLIICRLMGFISTDCQKQNLAIPESYFS